MSGFVYVLSNPSMPGLLKIGSTEKLPTERANQLYSTGVPEPFVVEFAIWCKDHRQVEAEVHEELEGFRASSNREFFRVAEDEAVACVLRCADTVSCYDLHLVDSLCFVDDSLIHNLNALHETFLEAWQWLEGITPEMALSIATNQSNRLNQIKLLREMNEVRHGG